MRNQKRKWRVRLPDGQIFIVSAWNGLDAEFQATLENIHNREVRSRLHEL